MTRLLHGNATWIRGENNTCDQPTEAQSVLTAVCSNEAHALAAEMWGKDQRGQRYPNALWYATTDTHGCLKRLTPDFLALDLEADTYNPMRAGVKVCMTLEKAGISVEMFSFGQSCEWGSPGMEDPLNSQPSFAMRDEPQVGMDVTLNSWWNMSWNPHPDTPHVNPRDNFAVRYLGEIYINKTGTYTFYVSSDDGAMLWIDDLLLVDNWGGRCNRWGTSNGTAWFPAGWKKILIRYFQYNHYSGLDVKYSGPDTCFWSLALPWDNLKPTPTFILTRGTATVTKSMSVTWTVRAICDPWSVFFPNDDTHLCHQSDKSNWWWLIPWFLGTICLCCLLLWLLMMICYLFNSTSKAKEDAAKMVAEEEQRVEEAEQGVKADPDADPDADIEVVFVRRVNQDDIDQQRQRDLMIATGQNPDAQRAADAASAPYSGAPGGPSGGDPEMLPFGGLPAAGPMTGPGRQAKAGSKHPAQERRERAAAQGGYSPAQGNHPNSPPAGGPPYEAAPGGPGGRQPSFRSPPQQY